MKFVFCDITIVICKNTLKPYTLLSNMYIVFCLVYYIPISFYDSASVFVELETNHRISIGSRVVTVSSLSTDRTT